MIVGDSVFIKNFGAGEAWLPGVIYSRTGPSSFTIDLMDGRRVRRHLDQLRKNTSATVIDEPDTTTETNDDLLIPMSNSPTAESPPDNVSPRVNEDSEPRRSTRTRRPPQRFSFDIN